MGRGANVNVDVNVPSTEGGNVNVQERRRLKKAYESRQGHHARTWSVRQEG